MIFIHQKALVFLKFKNGDIFIKENSLISEISNNTEIIGNLLKTINNYILCLDILYDLVQEWKIDWIFF